MALLLLNYQTPNTSPTTYHDTNACFTCDICSVSHFTGQVYHCPYCNNADFDMCPSCYKSNNPCKCGSQETLINLLLVPGRGRRYLPHPSFRTETIEGLYEEEMSQSLSSFLPPLNEMTATKQKEYNPDLSQYYTRLESLTSEHGFYVDEPYPSTRDEFMNWGQTYHEPKKAFHQNRINRLQELLDEFAPYAKYSARAGFARWGYSTAFGEVVDGLNILLETINAIERETKKISDLENRRNELWVTVECTAARHRGDTNFVIQANEWFAKSIQEEKLSYCKGRYQRICERVKDFEEAVRRAEDLETLSAELLFERLDLEIEKIKTGSEDSTVEQRQQAVLVLENYYSMRKSLAEKISDVIMLQVDWYQEVRMAEGTGDAVAEGEDLRRGARRTRDTKTMALESEFENKVVQPLKRSMEAAAAQIAQTQAAQAQASAATASQAATAPAASSAGVANFPRPKFQMPYSYYSNMLTRQHVTNMNVINNIAGGNNSYSMYNPTTGIRYW